MNGMTRFFGWWLPRLALAIAALVAGIPAGADVPAPLETIVDEAAHDQIVAQHLPGLVVLVAGAGTPVVRAYGNADIAGHVPVTADTRFQIGSITKQFTAACVMQLVEAHRLSLDDTLAAYVPSYAAARAVTIRDLLEQVSGIPEYLDSGDTMTAAQHPAPFAALLARIASKPLAFAPGTRWAYSNTNYLILGHIVELVSHEPWERYVREHIFGPAHMTHSGFIGEAMPGVTATGYVLDGGAFGTAVPLDETWAYAAGGIVSTAGDVLAWDRALLAGAIVPLADVDLMRRSAVLPDGIATKYGFGWIIDGSTAHPRVWHNGGTFGFSATNATFPSDGLTIVALTNLGEAAPVNVVGEIFSKLVPEALPTAAPAEDPAITARVREWLRRLQTGDIDRSQLGPAMSALLTPDKVRAIQLQVGALGQPLQLIYAGSTPIAADQKVYRYNATFAAGRFRIAMTLAATGAISGYFISPAP
jgi:CubicO group peptidase (beta-lactamase class C family)